MSNDSSKQILCVYISVCYFALAQFSININKYVRLYWYIMHSFRLRVILSLSDCCSDFQTFATLCLYMNDNLVHAGGMCVCEEDR